MLHGVHNDLPNQPQASAELNGGSFQFVRPVVGARTLYGLGTQNANLPGFLSHNPPGDHGGARNCGSPFLPAIDQGTKIGGGQLPKIYSALTGKAGNRVLLSNTLPISAGFAKQVCA